MTQIPIIQDTQTVINREELNRFREINWALGYLNDKKIIYGIKTFYENNEPIKKEFMTINVWKKGKFWYAGGKIISRNWKNELVRLGIARLKL